MRVARPAETALPSELREPDTPARVSSRAAVPASAAAVAERAPHGNGLASAHRRTRRSAERRAYARARLSLPLRVNRVAGQHDENLTVLRTHDISSSGAYFLSPRRIEPGTPVQIEVLLLHRPAGPGSVRMCTEAHVVRADDAARPGWHGLAVTFDDIRFVREGHGSTGQAAG